MSREMELNGSSNCEQDWLINELTQGMELAKQLKAQMGSQVAEESRGMLAEKIHSAFEKALLILKWGGSMQQSHQHVALVPSNTIVSGSPISVVGSPKSEDLNPGFNTQQDGRDFSRKRKMMPAWKEQVRINPENVVEGPPADGHSWRKYGQKDILGAKYPRSYYRCTYQKNQGCNATKQVQRNDEDASLFDITYKGTHTCTMGPRSKSAPTSPEKQHYNNQNNLFIREYGQQPNMLMNFQTGLGIDIQDLENQETGFEYGYENYTFLPSVVNDTNFCSSFTPSFMLSPATSGSNYFSASPCNMSTFVGVHAEQNSETDITEIISATTSVTNSPIVGTDFPLDQLEFQPNFTI